MVCGFVLAITATGRYFNRIGPRPLVVIGCLCRRRASCFVNVGLAMLLPAVAFALMGGEVLQQYGSEQRFLTMRPEDMPDASALWNLNRQLSFWVPLLLAQALSFMQALSLAAGRPHGMFVLPQSSLYCSYCTSTVLTTRSYFAQLQQEQP